MRINAAISKLNRIAQGLDPDPPGTFNQEQEAELLARRRRRARTPDSQVSQLRLNLRNYFRAQAAFEAEHGTDYSFSATPTPERGPFLPLAVQRIERAGEQQSSGKSRGTQGRTQQPQRLNKKRGDRVTKPQRRKHTMVTRSRAKPDQKFQYLIMHGRSP